MAENLHRRSRRMLELDLENEITPPSSPHDLPSIGQMNKEMHFDIENFPPFKSQIEGIIETLEEGYLRPSNPSLTDMNNLVIVELPTQTFLLSHQKYLPHIEALTTESLVFPSTSQNVPFSMANSTMLNTQPADLPTNYQALADTIGLDRPLVNLIQFGILDLRSVTTLSFLIKYPYSFDIHKTG